ncbi:BON domain-containing protein [Collimonas silvisoli]|uniref:BON domain-containing protein n=1 Tax=Collimonas silvisoli TaxID=2825884 RepID=UPI001B8AD001|nr:BON domain-containing protein [Collimonas silvisoli]
MSLPLRLQYGWPVRLAVAGMMVTMAPASGEPLKNWFNDPFIQVRSAVADCPPPLGPLVSQEEARKESHWRTERGTTCWLAGKCDKPNSYLYDAPIARSVQAHFAAEPGFARNSSLWLTFQRRFVWVEGCSADSAIDAAALAAFVRAEPDVERVIVNLRRPGDSQPPYPLAPAPHP